MGKKNLHLTTGFKARNVHNENNSITTFYQIMKDNKRSELRFKSFSDNHIETTVTCMIPEIRTADY